MSFALVAQIVTSIAALEAISSFFSIRDVAFDKLSAPSYTLLIRMHASYI